jgi:hypothetical protein
LDGAKVSPEKWPVTSVVLAVAPTYTNEPLGWHLFFQAEVPDISRVKNRVYLEGSYESAFALLYGYRSDVMDELGHALVVEGQPIGTAAIDTALGSTKVLRPIDKLNIRSMPVQDAIDFAFFLATSQVQMERFLPGEPYCGGAIDVMVLRSSPKRELLWFPGKKLHHPLGIVE